MRNLDEIVRPDVKFILGGKEYIAPGRISVEIQLRIGECGERATAQGTRDAIQLIWEILAPLNPERKREDFMDALTIEMIGPLLELMTGRLTVPATPSVGDPKNDSGAQRLDK